MTLDRKTSFSDPRRTHEADASAQVVRGFSASRWHLFSQSLDGFEATLTGKIVAGASLVMIFVAVVLFAWMLDPSFDPVRYEVLADFSLVGIS